jgi:hypothetical protein
VATVTETTSSDLPDSSNVDSQADSERLESGSTTGPSSGRADRDVMGALPQFAANLAGAPAARVAGALTGAADSIDAIASGDDFPGNDTLRDFATSASQKLRDLAGRADPEEAGRLVAALQRKAAEHPAATAGVGAALGAVLGLVLARLGSDTDAATPPVAEPSTANSTGTRAKRRQSREG